MLLKSTATKCALGLLVGGAAAVWALPMSGATSEPAPIEAQVPAPDVPGQVPDLQKQVDDALKELDKLEKIVPDQPDKVKRQIDDVRQQLRKQLLQGNGNPAPIAPGIGPGLGAFGGLGGGFGGGVARLSGPGQGRWGVALQRPTPVLIDQLKLPAGQGLVVAELLPESAAAKAGIMKHDILLEVDGKAVSSDLATFQKGVRDIKADVDVTVSVLRRGTRETIKGLRLPEAKAELLFQPFQIPPAPAGLPGGIALQVNGNGANEAPSVQIANDDFTINYAAGGLKATVKGKRGNGKATPAEITIQDGDTKVNAGAIHQVPERYRPTFTRMMESVK